MVTCETSKYEASPVYWSRPTAAEFKKLSSSATSLVLHAAKTDVMSMQQSTRLLCQPVHVTAAEGLLRQLQACMLFCQGH